MTPEEHIERAENLLDLNYDSEDEAPVDFQMIRVQSAAVHVAIADHKKKWPPETGRPMQRFPMGQIAPEGTQPYPRLPASHPMNQGRPIADNPQA